MANPTTPTLLTPSDESTVIGNVLVFTFTAPSDTDNDKLVFRVELDTVDPISSSNPNYKVYESRLSEDAKEHGTWEVDNGSGTYIAIPTGGMASTYYGIRALEILDRTTRKKNDHLQWILSHHRKNGGFYASKSNKLPDIDSTFYSIRALNILDYEFEQLDEEIEFLKSLYAQGGGFKPFEKGAPNIEATYCAVHLLKLFNFESYDILNCEINAASKNHAENRVTQSIDKNT